MERNGMYENTPWERIAEYGLWTGLGALVLAIAFYFAVKRVRDGSYVLAFTWSGIPAAIAAAVVGKIFMLWWVEAHANYPHPFGKLMLGAGVGISVIAVVFGIVKEDYRRQALTLSALLIPCVVAIYISAMSTSIIAEGQVTAMVLPYTWLLALVVVCGVVQFIPRPVVARWIGAVVLAALVYFLNYKLPVVQFHANNNVFPVMAPSYVAILAGFSVLFMRRIRRDFITALPGVVLAAGSLYLGYQLGYTYGVTMAVLGAALWWTLDTATTPYVELI